MEKKYKLTDEYIMHFGVKLFRIEALKDFRNVKKGDIGGYIETEDNLSQEGNCWIYDKAKVFGLARVYENASVCENAKVCDNAEVFGTANVGLYAQLFGHARVCDDACVYDYADVFGYAIVYGNAKVFGNAELYDRANVHDHATVCGYSKVFGNADVCGDALIKVMSDYIVFKNWWSSGRYFTWTRSNNMWKVGCFYGTGEELIAKAYKDSELSGREYERVVKYVESIINEDKYEKEN